MPRYPILLFWSEEDGCWIATVPDLEGCSAHGATPQQALAEVEVAERLWLKVAHEHGDPLPEPSFQLQMAGQVS